MGLPWVKVHVSILDSDIFQALTAPARLTFLVAIPLAEKLGQGGRLATRVGPLSISNLCKYTGLAEKHQRPALCELIVALFLEIEADGAYSVCRFREFQGDSSTLRTRAYRGKTAKCDVPVTFSERFRDVTRTSLARSGDSGDRDRDRDIDSDTLCVLAEKVDDMDGGSCLCSPQCVCADWAVETVSMLFLAVFANSKTEQSQRRLVSQWSGTLRDMRAQKYPWQAIWDAFVLAHTDVKHAPLHGLAGVWNNLRANNAKPSLRVVKPSSFEWANLSEKERHERDPGYIGTPPIEGIR